MPVKTEEAYKVLLLQTLEGVYSQWPAECGGEVDSFCSQPRGSGFLSHEAATWPLFPKPELCNSSQENICGQIWLPYCPAGSSREMTRLLTANQSWSATPYSCSSLFLNGGRSVYLSSVPSSFSSCISGSKQPHRTFLCSMRRSCPFVPQSFEMCCFHLSPGKSCLCAEGHLECHLL